MRALISLSVLIAVVLSIILVWEIPREISFSVVNIAAIAVLASVIILGFVSLLTLNKHKKFIEGLWLSLWSVTVAFLVTDFVAGQFLLEKLSPPIVKDEIVHHKLVPGTNSKFMSRDFQYSQRINQIGLRGKEINIEKAADTYRILMLGDSFTMGKGVNDNETFSALLEGKLTSTEKKVQVLNAGVDSYSPILSYRQLVTNLGPLLEPDLIVLNLDMSDLMQEFAYRAISVKDNSGEIIGFRSGLTTEHKGFKKMIKSTVNNNFYFTRILLAYLERWRDERDDNVTVENMVTMANLGLLKHTLADDDVDRTQQWQNIYASVLKIRNYCDDRGIGFLLTTYPWGHQVNNEEWSPGKYGFVTKGFSISDRSIIGLKTFSESNSIEFLNTFPAFRSYDAEPPIYYNFDMHWTATGHQIMAGELHDYISDRFIKSNRN